MGCKYCNFNVTILKQARFIWNQLEIISFVFSLSQLQCHTVKLTVMNEKNPGGRNYCNFNITIPKQARFIWNQLAIILNDFHSAICNHLSIAISMSPKWIVAYNRLYCIYVLLKSIMLLLRARKSSRSLPKPLPDGVLPTAINSAHFVLLFFQTASSLFP